ncbi:hypothetical protein [Thermoflavimicrobium dichotomicum]|uniref:hypothetical protein n=1 Tax=Thermoflavimicrobium dichotomicum TaxID=46223 RepID=UPI00111347B6|nr:hypothetical protein [Thermoflavimicrobium dichotomicum]
MKIVAPEVSFGYQTKSRSIWNQSGVACPVQLIANMKRSMGANLQTPHRHLSLFVMGFHFKYGLIPDI